MKVPPAIRDIVMRTAAQRGHNLAWPCDGRAVIQAEPVPFRGDVPSGAGVDHHQRRLRFDPPPEARVELGEVTYTALGMAWVEGRLDRRACFEDIGPRHLWLRPGAPSDRLDRATLLQSQTPRTYGDWVSEHVPQLARALEGKTQTSPLLLPAWWHAKPYVQRDLKAMGIVALPVNAPVKIARADVLQKTRPGHYWTSPEAMIVRRTLWNEPSPCDSGTAIYLSRRGERGEGPQRSIDNELTEAAMAQAGVTVVRTAGRTSEDWQRLAPQAETVFADHGSALYNVLGWRSRRIVELFSPNYWDSAFLFLADGIGLCDYHLWRIDTATSVASLASRITSLRNEAIRHPRSEANWQ